VRETYYERERNGRDGSGMRSTRTDGTHMLDISTLETWLWDAACETRGPVDAPKFKDYTLPLISLKRLSDVFEDELDEHGPYGRFAFGAPPSSTADWGWVQHMVASLDERGRMAVVLDTGAVSRGSGNAGSNRERDIRKLFVDGDASRRGDLIEAVVLLPENLFYNTSAPGIVLAVNRAKRHPGEMVLINASKLCAKGRPKNYLTYEHIA
jgi:type I restriction-modification system DNA methylase subunit